MLVSDRDFMKKLTGIRKSAYWMMEQAKQARSDDGLHPHQRIGLDREAAETLDLYFEAAEIVLDRRIKLGQVKIAPTPVQP